MKDLDYITLHFKNLEQVVIEPKNIIDLNIFGIETTIQSVGDSLIDKRDEADYIQLKVEEFDSDKSNELSVLYSDISPYKRLTSDTTIESIVFHYKKDDTDGQGSSEPETEEVYVPYLNETPETIGENELVKVTFDTFEVPYYEPRDGVFIEFNPEAKPY